MQWFKGEYLSSEAREGAHRWAHMNKHVIDDVLVIAVTRNSAIIKYVQDHLEDWIFFYIPYREVKPVYVHKDYIPKGRSGHSKRVKMAWHNYRMSLLATGRF